MGVWSPCRISCKEVWQIHEEVCLGGLSSWPLSSIAKRLGERVLSKGSMSLPIEASPARYPAQVEWIPHLPSSLKGLTWPGHVWWEPSAPIVDWVSPESPARYWKIQLLSSSNWEGNPLPPKGVKWQWLKVPPGSSWGANRSRPQRQSPNLQGEKCDIPNEVTGLPCVRSRFGRSPCHRCPPCWSTIHFPNEQPGISTLQGVSWFSDEPWLHLP